QIFNNTVSHKDLIYIAEMLHELFKIPVFFINREKAIQFEYPDPSIDNPLYHNTAKHELLNLLPYQPNHHPFPIFATTKYLENYFSIHVMENSMSHGMLTIGPCLDGTFSEEMINGII